MNSFNIYVDITCVNGISIPYFRLLLRWITIAVSAAFAGEFLSGEVLDAVPPTVGFLRRQLQNLLTRHGTGNAIRSQYVFPLPLGGSILRLLPSKTIDCDFSIGDLFLNRLNDFYGSGNGQGAKYTVCIQTVILLKTNGNSFRLWAPDPINLAAIVAEVI